MHSSSPESESGHLKHLLDHLAHLLPAQGPIGVFIHHNTLHAFQHLPFEQAVAEAARIFATEPYMREAAYRADLRRGRIHREDIHTVLAAEPDAVLLPGRLHRRELRLLMLAPGIRSTDPETLAWEIEEAGWAAADPSLWAVCLDRTPIPTPDPPRSATRPCEGLRIRLVADLDQIVHPTLIRLTGSFVDQGLAYWPMPHRQDGLLAAARILLGQKGAVLPANLNGLGAELARQSSKGMDAWDVMEDRLLALGAAEGEWEALLRSELLALPGWAGLVRCLEEDPGLAPHDRVRCSLAEFVALRLTLTTVAVTNVTGSARNWRATAPATDASRLRLCAAGRMFDVARLTRISARELAAFDAGAFARLQAEVESFDHLERRRVFHLAYERRHERQILLPLGRHRALQQIAPADRVAAQVVFCIDEREESIRRHLEETDPSIETFGAAGFFGVAVDYTGLDDAHGAALCPVVVKPAHAVVEKPVNEHRHLHRQRQMLRQLWARVARSAFISSRTLVRGWISTAGLGLFSLFPLAVRILSPLHYARLVEWLNRSFLPEPRTELTFMRQDAAGHQAAEGLLLGFSPDEKVDRVASVLGPAGLRGGMARLVIVLGHGSTSLNNPHESAHDCGACGGRRGGPNARLFAAMANHPPVRAGLRERGIAIPEDTWFIGGDHDTCNDKIDLYDLESLPPSHLVDLARVRASLDRARALSAHERARRFEAAGSNLDPGAALRHVEERAEHLAEPRPEYGHCTNAVAVVGRRGVTRGLFMDRRAFLISYDATCDPDNVNLGRVLGAVVPVCAGISLEYYFSFVDNERYGCGTKLPHNVSGLVGVMNGYEGDLRTGLPWQMVEIHEPVRILFVVETTPDRVLAVFHANPALNEFLANRWIRLATLDPIDGRIHMYRDGVFERVEGSEEELPVARSSIAWYEGKQEHLPLARIQPLPAGSPA